MSSIVIFFLFFIKVSVPAPFRHRYRFKSIGYVPVSDKNQTIPIPNENTNERERHRKKFTLGAGAVLHVPHGICLATVFNWLRHRNEAPKSALHFPIFFAFWTSHRQPRNGDTQPDVSVCSRRTVNSY